MCNVSVKYLKEHLRNAHKITEKEYQELFSDDSDMTGAPLKMFTEDLAHSPRKMKVMDDNLSVLSYPASNHSEEYMDYLGLYHF